MTRYPTHGLSGKRYREMVNKKLAEQDGKCAICQKVFYVDIDPYVKGWTDGPVITPRLDHCHKTGLIRGLLCNSCNSRMNGYERYWLLGNIPDWKKRTIIDYLDRYWSPGIIAKYNPCVDIMRGYHTKLVTAYWPNDMMTVYGWSTHALDIVRNRHGYMPDYMTSKQNELPVVRDEHVNEPGASKDDLDKMLELFNREE